VSAKPPAKDELQKKVEEVKQDADVQRALKQATPIEARKGPVARARDKFVIGTHLFLLIVLGAAFQLLNRLPGFTERYPLVLKPILACAVIVICLMVLRLLDVYFIGRVQNAIYQYNLKRVSRLVV
jgi:hypothetical protein